MDYHTSESCNELLDSQFHYKRLAILLLYTVSNVPSSYISIKLYFQTAICIKIELLGKKPYLDIS